MKLRWGILGVAKIATTKVIHAIQRAPHCEVLAIASRDGDRARAAAAALGIPRAYGSYEALLADPDVDVIYNPLPNHLHVPWSAKAALAGKHVLCEKPIALNAAEARTLLAVRDQTGVRIQEAFMIRTHPQWRTAKALVDEGRLGQLQAISGFFSYFNTDPDNVRNIPEFGGGGLLDIGCYLVNTARFLFGREPRAVAGAIERDESTKVDRLTSMLLYFGDGHAIGTCSTQLVPYQRVQVVGTKGRLEIEIPFNAPPDRPCRLSLDATGDLSGSGVEEIAIETCNQFTIQAEEFSRAILEHRPQPAPLEDAVANMACLDAIFRSAETGRWETPHVP